MPTTMTTHLDADTLAAYQTLVEDEFVVKDLFGVNHKPHPFTVGPKHVQHASDHCGGMLGNATINTIPCAYPRCNLPYAEHTYDNVMFLQLKKDLGNREAAQALTRLIKLAADRQDRLDGFVVCESDEKFRISPPDKSQTKKETK